MQVLAAAAARSRSRIEADGTWVPARLARLQLYDRGLDRAWSYARLISEPGSGSCGASGDITLCDDTGRMVAEMSGLELRRLDRPEGAIGQRWRRWLYRVNWENRPLAGDAQPSRTGPSRHGDWIIFADRGGVARRLAERLEGRGERSVLVFPGPGYRASTSGECEIRPGRTEDLDRLLSTVATPPRGIVHLWALDAPTLSTDGEVEIESTLSLGCDTVLALVQSLARGTVFSSSRLWLVTRGAQAVTPAGPVTPVQSMLHGFARSIAVEHPELMTTTIDLEPDSDAADLLCEDVLSGDLEDQIGFRGGNRYAARLVRDGPSESTAPGGGNAASASRLGLPDAQPFRLEVVANGGSSALAVQTLHRRDPGPGEVEIEVRAAGLNFRDVLNATGLSGLTLPGVGLECAGTISRSGAGVENFHVGDAVLGAAMGSFASFATTDVRLVVPKPPGLAFEDAATIPIAFLTAWCGLHHLGRTTQGEWVLIHSASGGVGMAAIQVAKLAGARIIATAGTDARRAHLLSLGIEHVFSSRTLDLGDQVRRATDGRGVDVVLNALPGEWLVQSLSLLAPGGRFIEIGATDIIRDSPVGLGVLARNTALLGLDVAQLCRDRPDLIHGFLAEIMRHVAAGSLFPLPREIFDISEAPEAFDYMTRRTHVGKIVLRVPGAGLPPDPSSRIVHRSVSADATYLVTGGFGGLGLAVADTLVTLGARHLVLAGRSGPGWPARETLARLRQRCPDLDEASVDVADRNALADLLDRIRDTKPPLRGLVHAAGVLDDGMLQDLTADRVRRVMRPKVNSAWNLHTLTAGLDLDFFVLFSSVASILGSPGQAAYGAANAFLDGLAQSRRALKLPALSINWGPWAEIGLASTRARARSVRSLGLRPIPPTEALAAFAHLIGESVPQAIVVAADWARVGEFRSGQRVPSILMDQASAHGIASHDDRLRTGLTRLGVLSADPVSRPELLAAYLRDRIGEVLGLSPARLDCDRRLDRAGLDSLMAVQVKNRVERDLGVVIPVVALLQGPSVNELAADILRRLVQTTTVTRDEVDHLDAATLNRMLSELERLPDDEARRLLVSGARLGSDDRSEG